MKAIIQFTALVLSFACLSANSFAADVFNLKCSDVEVRDPADTKKTPIPNASATFKAEKSGETTFRTNPGRSYSLNFRVGGILDGNMTRVYIDGPSIEASENVVSLIFVERDRRFSIVHAKRKGGVAVEKVLYFQCGAVN